MERKRYRLMLLFVCFSLFSVAQNNYSTNIYESFISGKMENWEAAVDEMESKKSTEAVNLLDLINYQYGYIGWCLGNDKKKDARHYLEMMEKNLELLKKEKGETANYHAYNAAAYGFKIGLSLWRAPFFGPKSMDHAEMAIEKDSTNLQANIEMGNIWNHMPEMFGGSTEKAMHYYLKAIEIFEKQEEEKQTQKWMYLNLLATVGQIENHEGNEEKALLFYKKALNIEPRFIWVKNELLPSLK
ncbi:Tetratricopeptide repeat-containing protein [Tangfeifania diversioriginum]|uniref:Tetratricopeptide repeat-containing protein n=1 Tax=Tangfeifania diversioriginum TaxID=1168035 RepID=A0A1M6B7A6_9BACT|nr:hypothetical protein [Tangfeifania diversioriginum]SHI44595.1 Tetratricopeptide repeat-containing protein [Tangfeifania diversioriginum]